MDFRTPPPHEVPTTITNHEAFVPNLLGLATWIIGAELGPTEGITAEMNWLRDVVTI